MICSPSEEKAMCSRPSPFLDRRSVFMPDVMSHTKIKPPSQAYTIHVPSRENAADIIQFLQAVAE
jgi:hypothetical protein